MTSIFFGLLFLISAYNICAQETAPDTQTVDVQPVKESDSDADSMVQAMQAAQLEKPTAPLQTPQQKEQVKKDQTEKKINAVDTKPTVPAQVPDKMSVQPAQQQPPQPVKDEVLAPDAQPQPDKKIEEVPALQQQPVDQEKETAPITEPEEPKNEPAPLEEKKKEPEEQKQVTDQEVQPMAKPEVPEPPREREQKDLEKPMPAEVDIEEDTMQEGESEIDTIDLDEGGNWLLKRKALEDTAEAIEKINGSFVKIIDVSTQYKMSRNKVDSELDVLIARLGFGLGDLDQALSNLLEDLEKERQEEGDLSADERDILYKVNEKKQEVQQLRESLQSLFGLEQNLDTVLNTVDTQVKTANNYQVQAWKNFQEIKQVLSDEKAEDLYYRSEGLYQSVEDILSYLDQKLMDYFNEQVSNLRAQMNDVKSRVESLERGGLDLKTKFKRVEEQEAEEKKEEKEVAKPKGKKGWWQTTKNIAWAPFDYLYRGWQYLTSFFVPAKKISPAEPPKSSSAESAVPGEIAST